MVCAKVITIEEVQTVVLRTTGVNNKILSYDLEPFSKIKTGCLGDHLLLTVRFTSQDGMIRTQTYFLKTQPESSTIPHILLDNNTFSEEVHFFSKIYPLMTKNYHGERWSPRCYLAKDNSLVFEDLRVQGYQLRDKAQLDEPSLKLAVATLARFHAASFALEAQLGRRINEVYPGCFVEKMYTQFSKFGRASSVGYQKVALIAETFGLDSGLIPKVYDWVYQRVRARKGRLNVICHGDLWMNNLMFNDVEKRCLLVDFQFLRYASLAVDIRMLLHLHTTPENRKKWELGLLRHYHSTLLDTITQTNSPDVEIPDFEEILQEYNEHSLVGMTYAGIFVPGTFMDPQDFVSILNDSNKTEEWFFSSKLDLVKKNIDKSSTYKNILRSTLTELLEEASRILSQ